MKRSEVFKNLIVDFYYFLLCVETKVLRSVQEYIEKLFRRQVFQS